jgi:hypothetical protein
LAHASTRRYVRSSPSCHVRLKISMRNSVQHVECMTLLTYVTICRNRPHESRLDTSGTNDTGTSSSPLTICPCLEERERHMRVGVSASNCGASCRIVEEHGRSHWLCVRSRMAPQTNTRCVFPPEIYVCLSQCLGSRQYATVLHQISGHEGEPLGNIW